jgi:transcriptional adapter 2-alpha
MKTYAETESKRPKEERELRDKLRVFSRFLSSNEMDKFVTGLLDERAIRAKLEAYRDARLAGATTLAEANRMAIIAAKASKARAAAAEAAAATAAAAAAAAAAVPSTPSDSKRPFGTPGSQANRSRARKGASSASAKTAAAASAAKTAADLKTADDSAKPSAPGQSSSAIASSGGQADARDRNSKGVVLGDVDLEYMPGAELMSCAEIALCSSLKLTPHQFLVVKDVMIRESARAGFLRKKDARSIVRLDPTKVTKIFDYMVACGWIRSAGVAGISARSTASPTVANGAKR